jgi:hypothetical protein
MKIKIYDHTDLNLVIFATAIHPIEIKDLFDKKSKFLHGSVFSIIQSSFQLSHIDFSYFELNRWAGSTLVSLRNHLQDNSSRLKNTNIEASFEAWVLKQAAGIDFLNELKKCSNDWRISWEKTKDEILSVYTDLIEIVDDCIDDDLIFYLKGY